MNLLISRKVTNCDRSKLHKESKYVGAYLLCSYGIFCSTLKIFSDVVRFILIDFFNGSVFLGFYDFYDFFFFLFSLHKLQEEKRKEKKRSGGILCTSFNEEYSVRLETLKYALVCWSCFFLYQCYPIVFRDMYEYL